MTAFGLPPERPFLNSKLMNYKDTQPPAVIVLDRIVPGVPEQTLPYCTHGRATCAFCQEWCWVGNVSHDLVSSGQAMPVCKDCAERVVSKDVQRLGNVGDHLRADGPH